ncbi:hypothetical protein [Streptomyces chilikensis]|uniref:HEAT repeat domain-containing protein n=1 Tax=Streptomyces chilikensis TaxID=1194079 RepID=A0ABV3EIH5_9ACTN
MPSSADRLLSALAPLSFPARIAFTARTARDLARREDGSLARLLAELDARGPYERRLAALAASAGRDAAFLAARLADPDRVVSGQALRAARTLPVPDGAIEAAYRDAPDELRHRLAALLSSGRRTALAERLLPRVREEWGDHEAARLLRACSTPFVARHLPSLAHAVAGRPALARSHPGPVLEQLTAELAERGGGTAREAFWRDHAPTVTALAPARPARVMELLERYGPGSVPVGLHPALPPLAAFDAERFTRWLVAREGGRHRREQVLPSGVLRALVRARPASLTALARHWAWRTADLRALLKAMPPAARPAFLDAALGGDGRWDEVRPGVLDLLPRERRRAEARREAAGFDEDDHWWERLDVLAHGSYAEAREELLAAVRRPDAEERGAAWPLLVRAASQDGDPGTVTELLTAMGRLRNDRDPVRRSALEALARVRPALFTAAHTPLLERVAADATEARDASPGTLAAVRDLATRVLAAHAAGARAPHAAAGAATAAEPRDWALATLERLTGRTGVPEFGPLHRVLRRGQEHAVLEALRPWLDAAAERADFRLLLGLAVALGPRARRMPGLQDRLATALRHGDDDTFRTAAELWLCDPSTRDERVARLLEQEPSSAVLPPVLRVLTRRRTDLLDVLLGDGPPRGRFLPPGARRPLPDPADAGRWLPRQQRAVAGLAARTAADAGLPLDERAAVIRAAAPLPGFGARLALRHAGDPEVVVAEAALAALPWTDRPHEALPVLLEHAATDRARVAVYAAARAARFTAPSVLAPLLGAVLAGERPAKVTSRKEAARLAARFLPPGEAVALLAGAFEAPDGHPDVRAAIVPVLAPLAGVARTWELLARAARDGAPQVAGALFERRPWELAEEHRPAFAALLGEAYDTHTAEGGRPAFGAPAALAAWARYDAALAGRLARTVCDLGNRRFQEPGFRGWSNAASALRDVAGSELPHPVGGAAEGSVLHGAVAGLLAALHTPEGGCEALEDRDLPALQRLRGLLEGLGGPRRAALARALAGQIAHEPLLAPERADLLASLVDLTAGTDEIVARLREVADALEGAGVLAAASVADRMDRSLPGRGAADGGPPAGAAGRLARDGGTVTGLLAVCLTSALGPRYRWSGEWRETLRVLRRHPDPDVRHRAHRTVTERE